MPSRFALSDKKRRQLLLASASAVVTAVLSGSAAATGPTAPDCPAVFPEFDCYAQYIACSTIPAGTQVYTGSPYKGNGHVVPFGSKEIFYLSSDGEIRSTSIDLVAAFPFWMRNGNQGTAQVNIDDLLCSSSPPSACDGVDMSHDLQHPRGVSSSTSMCL